MNINDMMMYQRTFLIACGVALVTIRLLKETAVVSSPRPATTLDTGQHSSEAGFGHNLSKNGSFLLITSSVQPGGNATTNSRRQIPPTRLKLPKPIFVLSLPKSGTTSMANFFNCGKVRAAHHWTNLGDRNITRIGDCMRANNLQGRPLVQGCGKYDVWTDAGVAQRDRCFYPSIHGLDNIASHYPNATIVLMTRNTASWWRSAAKWNSGILVFRWRHRCSGFPDANATDDDFVAWYDQHTQRIRDFAAAHPSLTYIEVQLESGGTPSTLEDKVGVSQQCWDCFQPSGKPCQPSST